MKTRSKRLVLNKETVRALQGSELRHVIGGLVLAGPPVPIGGRANHAQLVVTQPMMSNACATMSCPANLALYNPPGG